MKKSKFIFLITLIIFVMSVISAFAEADIDESTDTSAWNFNDSTGCIVAYNGTDSVVKVPGEIDGVKVTSIYSTAFSGNSNITDVIISEGITEILGSVNTYPGHYQLNIKPMPPYLVYEGAFMDCVNLKNVSLPSTLTYIGGSVFHGCESLESITIPDSVESIGEAAFKDCTSLTEVKLPAGITEIASETFDGCTALETIEIPEGVTKIGGGVRFIPTYKYISQTPYKTGEYITYQGVFSNCINLKNIKLSESLKMIEKYAFYNCTGLESIIIPDNVQTIGEGAFWKCSSLWDVQLSENIEELPDGIFADCIALMEIEIPESVTKISGGEKYTGSAYDIYNYEPFGAFAGCTSLNKINISENVVSISGLAFENCTSLKLEISDGNENYFLKDDCLYSDDGARLVYAFEIENDFVIPDNVTVIGYGAFCSNNKLIDVTIPSSVKQIESYAFCNNSALRNVNIYEDVEEIHSSAFKNCTSLEGVKIPQGVQSIEYKTFANCEMLEWIFIPESVTSIGESAFGNVAEDFAIYGYIYSYAHKYAESNSIVFYDVGNPYTPMISDRYKVPIPDIKGGNVVYGTQITFSMPTSAMEYSINGSEFIYTTSPLTVVITEDTEITVTSKEDMDESFVEKYITYRYKVMPTEYFIDEIRLETTDGTTMEAVPTDMGFVVNIGITELKERDEAVCFIVAVYDTDGAIIDLQFVERNIDIQENIAMEFSAQEKDIGSVKAFVWSDFDSAEPLATVRKLDVASIEEC